MIKKTKKVQKVRERMIAGKSQPSIMDKLRRKGRDEATREVLVGVKEYLSGESSQDEGCDGVGKSMEEYASMESEQVEGCDDMLVRDDVSVLDEEFWKWLTKCEIRADPVSVALLISIFEVNLTPSVVKSSLFTG